MKTQEEIKERQDKFVKSYRFPESDTTPKMKAWTSAINASVRTRGYRVYSGVGEERANAVSLWKAELERLGEKYKHFPQTKDQFIDDVFALKQAINSYGRDCFAGDGIRIGQCQKSLSIFLKWMWCQGQLADVPPVCPVDGQVLAKCRAILKKHKAGSAQDLIDTHTAWSNLDDPNLYKRLVRITEAVAALENEEKTCVWELFAFDEPS